MKHLIFLLAVISLTACTSTPPHVFVADPNGKWEQRQTELSKINDWHLNGRVAIINGEDSWHLNMEWQRHDDKYILDLSGPFGVGHAQLSGTNDGVILIDSDEKTYYADSPEYLLKEISGLQMPVTSLLYWMRGLPNKNIKKQKQKIDEFGRLQYLQQGDWSVRFKRYVNVAKNELPQKIFINGHGLKIKIFVDEWDLKSKTFKSTKAE